MEIAVASSSSTLELVRDMSPRIVSSHHRGILMPLLARFEKNDGVNEGKDGDDMVIARGCQVS